MISIIMPAYNEAAVIAGTLASLIDQDTDIPFEVIVIANGCDDDTADRARAMAAQMAVPGRSLRVIETDRRGKTNAFNLGDAQARYGARIYMDGDLRVSNNLVACSAPLLADETACYLGYRLETAPSRSFITSAYGRMWSRSPRITRKPQQQMPQNIRAFGG